MTQKTRKFHDSKLYNFLSIKLALPEDEINTIFEKIDYKTLPNRSILLELNSISNQIIFVEKGILREFEEEEEEIFFLTTWLVPSGHFAYLHESFLNKTPSKIGLQAIEQTEVWTLDKQVLEAMNLKTSYILLEQLNTLKLQEYRLFLKVKRKGGLALIDWFDKFIKGSVIKQKYATNFLGLCKRTYINLHKQQMLALKKNRNLKNKQT